MMLYLLGAGIIWRRAGYGRGVRVWQLWSFVTAIVLLAVALLSPLDELSEKLFSAHMTQHLLLTTVVPPFLVLGAPQLATAWILPRNWRLFLFRRVKSTRVVVTTWRFITGITVATVLHGAAMWIWHVPVLYEAALASEQVHFLEHASFVGTAVLLWWGIVNPRRSRRESYGIGVAAIFFTAMHTGVLGALFTLSDHVWYRTNTAEAFSAAAPFMPALKDQQLAGLIMWVVGGMLYVATMSALFLAWVRYRSRHAAQGLVQELIRGGATRKNVPMPIVGPEKA